MEIWLSVVTIVNNSGPDQRDLVEYPPTKLKVRFPVRAHAWVVAQSPDGGMLEATD